MRFMQSGFSDNLDKAPMSHPKRPDYPLKQFLIYILHACAFAEFVFSYKYFFFFFNEIYRWLRAATVALML